ncbi:MAG: iron ABC transporter permease [Thermoplasmata archaeon]|nr:iron ABC transporter permease [Thermoplasmata archaeon]
MTSPVPPRPADPSSKPSPRRHRLLGRLLVLAGIGVVFLSPLIGTVAIPAGTVGQILLHQASGGVLAPDPCASPGGNSRICSAWVEIVWQERLPEILLALIAGAALGISGGTLQGIFRNPLADPYLLGLSSGGTLGASLLFVFHFGATEANLILPVFAFAGAMATGAAILAAARGLKGSVETLLLTGVALASFLSAALSVVLLYNPVGSLQVSFWLLGGLGGATWSRDGICFGVVLIAAALLSVHGREVNILQLGPDVAQSVGVDATRIRRRLLLLASLATAMAVAFTGVIGFVGLVAPHVVRRTLGSDYRIVLPGSALVGGAFLLAARDLSILAIPTSVLPVGIFTSFAGAPFFLYLLYRRRRSSTMGET